MLSFQEYVWELKMRRVYHEIAWHLVVTGKTPGKLIEDILFSKTQIHNEFIGSLFNAMGRAWHAFWHDDSQSQGVPIDHVNELIQRLAAQYEEKLAEFARKVNKSTGGSAKNEIESLYSDILKKVRGDMYDFGVATQEFIHANAGKFEKGGIMEQTLEVLKKMQRLTMDPRISDEDRASGFEEIHKEIAAMKERAVAVTKNDSATPEQKEEANKAISKLNDPAVAKIMETLSQMKEKVKDRLSQIGKDMNSGDDIDDAAARRAGIDVGDAVPERLPDDPKAAIAAIRKKPALTAEKSVEAWYKSLKQDVREKLKSAVSTATGNPEDGKNLDTMGAKALKGLLFRAFDKGLL